jgi:DNA-binding LacI/PurR family transcriptional regulator
MDPRLDREGRIRPITISDVARMADVGVATVSRVMNKTAKVSPKTEARVLRVLEQTKFRPAHAARSLARGRTNTIELLYNTYSAKLSQDPVLLSILDSAHARVQQSGNRLVFSAFKNDFDTTPVGLLQTLSQRMADGALLVSCAMTDQGLQTLQGLPLVLIDNDGKDVVTSVTNDNYRVVRDAVAVLAEKGHRDIALISSCTGLYNDVCRLTAFHDEMERRRLKRRAEWEPSGDDPTATCRAMFSGARRPTALVITAGFHVPQILSVVDEKGLQVPRDVSLVWLDSVGNLGANESWPARPVSCYRLDWDAVIGAAMEALVAILAGEKKVRRIEVPVPFHGAGTVAPPPSP